jgi:hypothetical protein
VSKEKYIPFNPLDKRNLGENVCQALLRQQVVQMTEIKRFNGAGIYGIYYAGDFSVYRPISELNSNGKFRSPIYVGKAVPAGARKGSDLEAAPRNELHIRLGQHARSIEEASNLLLSDFFCRYLAVDDIWIPLAESLLISTFNPLWNKLIDGFGNHDPGRGRHAGLRPRWDVLHPGRTWADRCKPRPETATQILREIKDYLKNNPPQALPFIGE